MVVEEEEEEVVIATDLDHVTVAVALVERTAALLQARVDGMALQVEATVLLVEGMALQVEGTDQLLQARVEGMVLLQALVEGTVLL